MGHRRVFLRIIQQARRLQEYLLFGSADQTQSTCSNPLRTLGGVAHNQYGFPEARRLFLDSSGIRQNQVTGRKEVVEIKNLQRFNDSNPIATIQFFMSGGAHYRIHVDWIDGLKVFSLVHQATDCPEHIMHGLAKVLAPMRRNKNESTTTRPFKVLVPIIVHHGCRKRIYAGISRYINPRIVLSLIKEILPRLLRWRKVILRNQINGLAVELLRKRRFQIVSSEPRLYVPHGNLKIEAREGGGKTRSCITMHQHHIRLIAFKDVFHAEQNKRRNIKERLARPHYGEVIIRMDVKHSQHLRQHFSVLPSYANLNLKLRTRFKLVY